MGGKKKRHETASSRSSSIRLDSTKTPTQTTHHVTSVGCMSGIFHFVSKYHTRRKFLTFGKKHERKSTPSPPTKPPKSENGTCKPVDHEDSLARASLEVLRSPAIPAEIRKTSLDSLNSPRIVARLMGLEDTPPHTPPPVKSEVAAENRRKLLGALERCDEDLQALRKIIQAVRSSSQSPPRTPPPHAAQCGGVKEVEEDDDDEEEEEEEREDEMGSEEPSPVSVLDHHMLLTRSPSISCSKRTREGENPHQHQQQKQQFRRKLMEEEKANFYFQYKPYASSSTVLTISPQRLYLPAKTRQQLDFTGAVASSTAPWSSAVRETVIEVCKDVERGPTREVASIGLLLQDIIYRDLIDEIIYEFKCLHVSCTYTTRRLPHEACKRKLSF